MFATLAGAYPRTPLPGRTFRLRDVTRRHERGEASEDELRAVQDDVVPEVLAEQADMGLELLSDGNVRWDDPVTGITGRLQGFRTGALRRWFDTNRYFRQPVAEGEPRRTDPITLADWQFAASSTDLPVKQTLTGPYTLGRLADPGPLSRERLTMALADVLAQEIDALEHSGCQIVQIDEPAAVLVGTDRTEQQLFKAAHRRLTYRTADAHLSLAITGGSAHMTPSEVIFDAPYRSFLFDLVEGRRNWALIAECPGECGVICGVANARSRQPDDRAFIRWAARYAAASGGRGWDRVGIATSESLEGLPRDRARAKIDAMGVFTVELATEIAEGRVGELDAERLALEGLARGYLGADDDSVGRARRALSDEGAEPSAGAEDEQ